MGLCRVQFQQPVHSLQALYAIFVAGQCVDGKIQVCSLRWGLKLQSIALFSVNVKVKTSNGIFPFENLFMHTPQQRVMRGKAETCCLLRRSINVL